MIAGYCWPQSGRAGETVSLHLHSDHGPVDVAVVRVGAREERIARWTNVKAPVQSKPENAALTGCNWPATLQIHIENDWQTGFYRVDIRSEERSGEAFFVVKAQDNTKVDAVLVLATSTWAAYNDWGGPSYYTGGTVCALKRPLPRGFLKKDNPRKQRCGLFIDWTEEDQASFRKAGYSGWSLPAGWAGWEQLFVQWAETQGLSLAYGVSQDLIFDDSLLDDVPLYLSVGHDEYWSSLMRDNLEKFIVAGGNVAFFSGNTCCWQVRSEDKGNALTCWKQGYNLDPIFRKSDHKLLSTLWSHHLVQRPENKLTGVGFLWGGYHRSHGQFMDGPASFIAHRPKHWVFEGTKLKHGDRFGGKDTIVGYECDGCEMKWENGLPSPTGRDGTPKTFTILGTCPARWAPGDSLWYDRFPKDRVGAAVMGLYTRGGTVFTSGTTDWAHGLRGKDPAVERITRNILNRLSK